VKSAFDWARTRFNLFSACLRGELKQCREELESERNRLEEERHKVDSLTRALTSLGQKVLNLFDREEEVKRLEWDIALSMSERADDYVKYAWYHHVTKVVYYDSSYATQWVHAESARQTRDFFVKRFFIKKDAQQLRNWIEQILEEVYLGENRVSKSLIVFAQDVVPETVAEVPNKSCLLRKYLEAGGRIVWKGDIPFWYQAKSGGAKDEWGLQGPLGVLDVDYTNHDFAWVPSTEYAGKIWDQDFPMQLTPAGYDIGLSWPQKRIRARPVSERSVEVPYLRVKSGAITLRPASDWDGDELALCWKKNFNPRFPYNGFMQYITGGFLPNEVNNEYFRFAVSGWPLLFG
jgi:hypothetical protein